MKKEGRREEYQVYNTVPPTLFHRYYSKKSDSGLYLYLYRFYSFVYID